VPPLPGPGHVAHRRGRSFGNWNVKAHGPSPAPSAAFQGQRKGFGASFARIERSTSELMSSLAPTRQVGSRLPSILAVGLLLAALVPGTVLRPIQARAYDCAVNPIPCENQLQGTDPSIWDTPNGDAGSPNLQGFATDISVNAGQTVSFK